MTSIIRPVASEEAPGAAPKPSSGERTAQLVHQVGLPVYVVEGPAGLALETAFPAAGHDPAHNGQHHFAGYVPACPLELLGDAGFRRDHGLRYAYYAGAMANGIASVE
ncbi:MAG: hypothetical protein HYZ00_03775, partial [Candidatus Hydrogenedentes bacterium]|nr:hypothetical protein [Candidatus Hydrogenedentota bacterium]